ncbi:MAG: hypothetical protein QOF76_2439 [Solirubrobacteraceae bacterium]|nr:hypothetical protein [Solirubrobacteraceae bacterium]
MSVMSLIQTPDQITAAWLSEVLGRSVEPHGTAPIGTGQMSQNHRVSFGDGESVVVKLASADPTSRGTGVGMGAYMREVAFYSHLAARLEPVPACHLAVYDDAEGWFTLVLDDVVGATQGDQIAGCSVDQARAAMTALAACHAPVLGDLHVGMQDWLNLPNPLTQDLVGQLLPGFLERYKERLAPEHADVCRRFAGAVDAWAADSRPPLGLIHGDYRLDNLLYRPDGTCAVVDWQTVTWGPAMLDAAYFIGGGLSPADRRANEEALVRGYHDALLAHGVQNLGWDECWEEYRRRTFHGILMTIVASMVVQRTGRGDDMFMTWLARNAEQVLDLDALELLPAAAGRPAPLRPAAADEGRHEPGPEPLWNESWYFDAVSDAADLGVYVRLGRLPNQGVALYTACVTGPDRPSIMLVGEVPLPDAADDTQAIDVEGLRAAQVCETPLQRWRVTCAGTGAAHADGSAPLRAEPGEPVEVGFELTWETAGVPFQWRQSTRYEIPCRVTGTVTVGDEQIAFGGPGQRDHSWGSRDWWAMDWMWSGLHFSDGTHTHAVGLPNLPGVGVGYVQRDGVLTEIESCHASEEVADNGLITRARIESGPDALVIDVEPLAFGALRLESPDGRLSLFPRAMCRLRKDDGVEGTGWVEWNRVQPMS